MEPISADKVLMKYCPAIGPFNLSLISHKGKQAEASHKGLDHSANDCESHASRHLALRELRLPHAGARGRLYPPKCVGVASRRASSNVASSMRTCHSDANPIGQVAF